MYVCMYAYLSIYLYIYIEKGLMLAEKWRYFVRARSKSSNFEWQPFDLYVINGGKLRENSRREANFRSSPHWMLFLSLLFFELVHGQFRGPGLLIFAKNYTSIINIFGAVKTVMSWLPSIVELRIVLLGSLSKHDVDDSKNVIWKCNFAFLQSSLNYSKSLRSQNVFKLSWN